MTDYTNLRQMQKRLDELAVLARALLPQMVDPMTRLMAHKASFVDGRLRRSGYNALYTAMALVGMAADSHVPSQVTTTIDGLAGAIEDTRDPALLGASTWAFALLGDSRSVETARALATRVSLRDAGTMSLGLALAGVSAAAESSSMNTSLARAVARQYVAELLRRRGSGGYWRASGHIWGPGRLLNRGLTSFASQVYPLLGLAEYARVFDDNVPPCAQHTAESLVDAQGPLGQWWWLYSENTGSVLDGYPVYSVHQDAMAFMGLVPLQRLGIGAYDEPLSAGLQWLDGKNEVTQTLVNANRFIFRAVQRRGSNPDGPFGLSRVHHWRALAAAKGAVTPQGVAASPGSLEILRECRPYHLGWILLARALVSNA